MQLVVRQVCAGGGGWACVAAEVLRRLMGQEAAGAGMGGGFYVCAHAVVLAQLVVAQVWWSLLGGC